MAKKTGLSGAYDRKHIVFDHNGVPWVVDPENETIQLARVIHDDLKPAVKKRK